MQDAYVEFENRFRGTVEVVREEQKPYLRYFSQAPVVDIGCGRGEFLDLLREAGIEAWGADSHPDMVRAARARGLDVRAQDAVEHLEGLPPASLGGIFMCHVIEHLPRRDVLRFIALASRCLRPGGTIVIETLNPQCLFAHAPFTMDLSHEWPIHPQTLQFLLEAHDFNDFETTYRQYLPPEMLQLIGPAALSSHDTGPAPSTPFEHAVSAALQKMQLIVDLAFRNFIYTLAAKRGEASK